ncbi:hypothetical protein [Ferrimonas balearica]|uniref:hypothetical protein n=1 Tax=Ferrimonas balearica TaxID=44012 RepID=UPI001C99FE46|nr:hypothetical protein [Ferrimonas balearica]MBY5992913.1 hypothetical protein [Ferrimonas balearica]
MTLWTRTLCLAALALTTLYPAALWADSLTLTRQGTEPVKVVLSRDGERLALTLDPASPDWGALETALADSEHGERWLELARSAVAGEGELHLALHSGAHHRVHLMTLPGEELELEFLEQEAMAEQMAELHRRLEEEGVRLEEEARRIEAHVATIKVPEVIIHHRGRSAEAITHLIDRGQFSEAQLDALEKALADKRAEAHEVK